MKPMRSGYKNCIAVLLKSSYLPDDEGEALRSLVRYRKTLTQDCNRFVLRMQKSMELMNIKLHTIICDITGESGLAVINAIISGERVLKT
jgi:transposase